MARPLIRGLCAVVLAGSAGAAILLGGNAPASAAVTSTVGTVDSGSTPLNIRSSATISASVVGPLRTGSSVTLVCQVTGQTISGRVRTRYCHMARRPSVAEGQWVNAGQIIGYVGTSGNSGGTHLHFEVHVGPGYAVPANAVDPIAFMQRMNAPLGVLTTR